MRSVVKGIVEKATCKKIFNYKQRFKDIYSGFRRYFVVGNQIGIIQ